MIESRRLELVAHLAAREFKLRYRRSILGWTWAVVLPLVRLLVLVLVFSRILKVDIEHYAAFLYIGLVSWTWFSAGVSSTTTSVVDRTDLMMQPRVDRVALPVTAAIGDTVDYLISLPLLAAWVAFDIGLTPSALAVLPLAFAEFGLILGAGLLLAPLHVHARDVVRVIDVALLLGFYMTPVLYEPDAIPEKLRWLATVNPIAWIIDAQRTALYDGSWPSLAQIVVPAAAAAVILLAGVALFGKLSPTLVDEL